MTAEPGGLPSMGSHRVRHDWSNLAAAAVDYNFMRAGVLSVLFLVVFQVLEQFLAHSEHSINGGLVAKFDPCDPMDCSPSGSSVHGIFQARILEWIAISFSRGSSWPRAQTCISWVSCIGRQILYHHQKHSDYCQIKRLENEKLK